jgi:hypothetical protein
LKESIAVRTSRRLRLSSASRWRFMDTRAIGSAAVARMAMIPVTTTISTKV